MSIANYIYLRALELEGRHPVDAGAWSATVYRILSGEGLPPGDTPAITFEANRPLPVPTRFPLHTLRRNRASFHSRIRSVDEVLAILRLGHPVSVSVQLSAGWIDPPGGLIRMPLPNEVIRGLSHSTVLTKSFENEQLFQVHNSWGTEWGNFGVGYLPFEYLAKYLFESWFSDFSEPRMKRVLKSGSGFSEILWLSQDWAYHDVHGFEIRDSSDRRIAWAFVVHRDGSFDVEDFFVWPEFRGRGFGNRIANLLFSFMQQRGGVWRMWMPFADSRSESPNTYVPMCKIVDKLGLKFRPSGVPWAAYLATNTEDADSTAVPSEPPAPPSRPRGAIDDLRAAVLAATVAISGASQSEILPRPGNTDASPPLTIFQTSPLVVGSNEWLNMNQRRMELIQKEISANLTESEARELLHLQEISLTAVETAFPRAALDFHALETLKKRLDNSAGTFESE